MDGEGQMVAAMISSGTAFRVESREQLFLYQQEYSSSPITRMYDITGDDQRFLMVRPFGSGDESPSELIVVENFVEELKERVPN